MSVIEIKATVPRVEIIPVVIGGHALRRRRLTMAVFVPTMLFGVPSVTGDVEVLALHLIGLGIGGLPFSRFIPRRTVQRLSL